MNSITRWDPIREMMAMRNTMDRLFDNFMLGRPEAWEETPGWSLALDVAEDENEFVVKASLPGINPDDLDVTFVDDCLTIKGEIKSEEEQKGARYHLRERRYGSFARSVTLPRGIKAEEIKADYEAGILTLHIPKAEEIKPKRIEIKTSKAPEMIEGELKDIAHKN